MTTLGMNTLGVILARGGSVGLPGKHLLPLLGQPVITYTFGHARAAGRLTRLVVSSDSHDILRLATANGFDVIHRPALLATSDASVQDVMLHALDWTEAHSRFRADALVVLYGNIPVRPEGMIDAAIEKLEQTQCDSVRSFCPVGKWHPYWMSRLKQDRVEPFKDGSVHRRQDLPAMFLHDGGVVAVSRAAMLRGRTHPDDPHAFFGIDRRGIETEMGAVVEIDHRRDLFWAQAVLQEQSLRRSA